MKRTLLITVSLTFAFALNAQTRFCGIHDYAVILNGGGNTNSNLERYWNNCSTMYKLLVNDYGYPKSHIFIIMSDGSSASVDRNLLSGGTDSSPLDLDGDGTNETVYSATKTNISTVFNTLQSTLSSSDNLFVYTTGPGQRVNGNSYLVLWDDVNMSASELNTEINKVGANVVNILMQQDYGAGLSSTLAASNRAIIYANSNSNQELVLADGSQSAFTYFFARTASRSAAKGAEETDVLEGDEPSCYLCLANETNEEATNNGYDLNDRGAGGLEGSNVQHENNLGNVIIQGPSYICGSTGYYYLDNTSPLETFQWSTSNSNLVITSGQGTNSITVSKVSDGSCIVSAYVTILGEGTRQLQKATSVGLPPSELGSDLSLTASNGCNGYWVASNNGNKFSILGSASSPSAPYKIEARLYSLDANFNPDLEMWRSIYSSSTHHNLPVTALGEGWYLLKVRAFNNCGYSEWLDTEVEIVDLSSLCPLLEYDSSTESLVVTFPDLQNIQTLKTQSTPILACDIQIWNNTSMLKRFSVNQNLSRLSLTGLPNGVYAARILIYDHVYSRKFVKR